jgi:hypothetical protein
MDSAAIPRQSYRLVRTGHSFTFWAKVWTLREHPMISSWLQAESFDRVWVPGSRDPLFPNSGEYDLGRGTGNKYVEEPTHGVADDRGAETARGGTEGGRCGEGSGRVQAHDLCLEGKVRWDGCEPGTGSEAVAG